jgi:hypothetical protein
MTAAASCDMIARGGLRSLAEWLKTGKNCIWTPVWRLQREFADAT